MAAVDVTGSNPTSSPSPAGCPQSVVGHGDRHPTSATTSRIILAAAAAGHRRTPREVHRAPRNRDRECGQQVRARRRAQADRRGVGRGSPPDRARPPWRHAAAAGDAHAPASEALANATKHAQASRIDVSLAPRDGVLLLSIRDDGVGGADSRHGSGLVGLHDRVEALGGTIRIESPPGAGTLLVVALPLEVEPAG
jgi:hypothetical protein